MMPVAGLLLGEGDRAKEQVMLLLAETVLNLLPFPGNALEVTRIRTGKDDRSTAAADLRKREGGAG